jgi:glucose-6-phosphate 1-dehydrogenase
MMYLGGLRDTPIDESMSHTMGVTTYSSDAYSIILKDYMRFDLRLSWRKDKVKYTRTIALDVQNIAGIKNQAYRYYDAFQAKVVMQYQVGFIPVLVYRIDF